MRLLNYITIYTNPLYLQTKDGSTVLVCGCQDLIFHVCVLLWSIATEKAVSSQGWSKISHHDQTCLGVQASLYVSGCSVSHTLTYLWRTATISKLTATNRFSKRLWFRWINMNTACLKSKSCAGVFISLYFRRNPTVLRKFSMSFSFYLACNAW